MSDYVCWVCDIHISYAGGKGTIENGEVVCQNCWMVREKLYSDTQFLIYKVGNEIVDTFKLMRCKRLALEQGYTINEALVKAMIEYCAIREVTADTQILPLALQIVKREWSPPATALNVNESPPPNIAEEEEVATTKDTVEGATALNQAN